MAFLQSTFGASKDEVWKQFSEQISGEFQEGTTWKGGKVTAKADHWTVTLDTYRIDTQHNHHIFTRLRAPYVNKDGFRFCIYKETLLEDIKKILGMQDIVIGTPDFDEYYIIQASDEEKAKRLFSSETLREKIKPHPDLYMEVKNDDGYFSETFPEGVDELLCLIEGEITQIDQLNALYDLFAEVLNTLCHLGSAYEDDPNLSV
ncbi:MAG: DUF3137 domain-containing protein [bacterium]|jgi:hypothetical protein|nr:DUF3137 domain-containing protein [bacterium]